MSDASSPAIGIDLGTTHSVIAYADSDGKPATLHNAEGDITTPSVVFFDRNSIVVGKEAVKAARYDPTLVAQFAKRDVGYSAYRKKIRGDKLPPEVIQALILKKLKQDAERKVGAILQAVITVPAFFNEPRRKSTQDAGYLAGLQVLDIINEPTAAAIAFGVKRGFLTGRGEAKDHERVLVYDLGGGTFDATLMDIQGFEFNAVATVGDVMLGGIDWDARLVNHLAERFLEEFRVDPRDDPESLQALIQESEDAKHALTARDEVTIQVQHAGHRMRVTLTRSDFEAMTRDLLERTSFTVRNLLRDAGVQWSDLTRILLVGGSTRMPMVAAMLEKESGTAADCSLSPDESVAHGAAIYADLLLAGERSDRPRMSIRNVNSHDLGVLGFEPRTKRRRRQVLVPRNTPLPAKGGGRFVTQKDGQVSVKVDVVEGGDASGNGATSIGKCVITDLPPSLPSGTRIEVTFKYASNGRLSVNASLPEIDRQATMSIERTSGLSTTMLRHWEERLAEGLKFTDDAEPAPQAVEAAAKFNDAAAMDDTDLFLDESLRPQADGDGDDDESRVIEIAPERVQRIDDANAALDIVVVDEDTAERPDPTGG